MSQRRPVSHCAQLGSKRVPTLKKPRFHDEECFGANVPIGLQRLENTSERQVSETEKSSAELIKTAEFHFSRNEEKSGVDNLISAYENLERDRANLTALRNAALRNLSTSKGWHSAPHPQALRLRRLTPSLPSHLNQKEI